MKRRVLAMTIIPLLILITATQSMNIDFGIANFMPETPPPGIRINSDGNVEGTNALRRVDNVYSLTRDISDTIVVLCDDIILDGAGYTLQGKGESTGVFLQDMSSITIKNLKIANFHWGIKSVNGFSLPSNPGSIIISENTITQNHYGLMLASSTKCRVFNNNITDNTVGASIYSNNVFRNNRFENNKYTLDSYIGNNNFDSSNTVNNKPIYYWINQHGRTVPSNAGLIVLIDCSGITVENLTLENNGNGLYLSDTTSSMITGNNLKNNKNGLTLFRCSNNTISGNWISNNDNYGIAGENSPNNEISKNRIMLNAKGGITLDNSINNTIIENKIDENGGNGIFLTDTKDSNIINNEVSLNTGCGIGFGYGPKGNVKGNIVSNNDIGIWMSNAFENTITFNNVTQNRGWAVYLEGSQKNNIIHHNNFIDNYSEEGCQVFIKGLWVYPGLNFKGPPSEAPPPELVAGAGNFWDNDVEGNYWSDYYGADVDADGIGDTEYWINENNADEFPFAFPITKQANQPTPTPAPYPTLEPAIQSEPLPTLMIIGPITSLAIASAGLLAYFKKRK